MNESIWEKAIDAMLLVLGGAAALLVLALAVGVWLSLMA